MILSKEPDAKFSEVGTKFITTFKRKSYYEGKKGVEKTTRKTIQKGTQKILEMMRKQTQVTIKELAESIGISDKAIKKNIAKLKERGLFRRIGPGQRRALGSGGEMDRWELYLKTIRWKR